MGGVFFFFLVGMLDGWWGTVEAVGAGRGEVMEGIVGVVGKVRVGVRLEGCGVEYKIHSTHLIPSQQST